MSTPGDDELYQKVCASLGDRDAPLQKSAKVLPLLVTIALFAAAILWMVGSASPLAFAFLAVLIGVLLLHESGHYLGMTIFGYRDVRMFFIPFFGAAVTGEKHAAPAWQQAIVLLLGPLPGIALAALIIAFRPEGWIGFAAYFLMLVNGLNLLPFVPLDGGRLLQLLLFARHPLFEFLFLLVSGIGLALIGWIQGSWIFGGLGVVMLLAAPFQYHQRRARLAAARQLPALSSDLDGLAEDERNVLFRSARAINPESSDPAEIAGEMTTLHEIAATRPAGALATIGLLSLYLAGVAATLAFDPFGVNEAIASLNPTPIVGHIAGAFEFPSDRILRLQKQRGATTNASPRQNYKFIGLTFEVDGDKSLVTDDYVVLDGTGNEFTPLGISTADGFFYDREYVQRVDLHRDLNSPITFGGGGVSQLALLKPQITLLYEVPAEEHRFQLRHNQKLYDFKLQPPQLSR